MSQYPNREPIVDFGFQQVPASEKNRKVGAVFQSVATNYDVMNDLMSFGIHRFWKRFAVSISGVRQGNHVLDLAGGTGDLTRLLSDQVGKTGQVYLMDINAAMLQEGRDRLLDQGYCHIHYAQANAEQLPLAANQLQNVFIGFGLRNVTYKEKALREMYRVLQPGGCLVVLEFSKPLYHWLQTIYDQYSFHILPGLGKLVAQDEESYRYLAESIRKHPDQETLRNMICDAGFDQCEVHNLTGGIVAVHKAYKY